MESIYQETGTMGYLKTEFFLAIGKMEYGKKDNLTAIGKAVSKNNFQIMKKRKLVEELSELIFSDEKIKISKTGENLIFEIGKETTSDLAEAVAIMMKFIDNNHKLWNFEFKVDTNEISPSKSLFWLSGGKEWNTSEHYKASWSESYLLFQEEFGISIINIVKKSKNLKEIREGFKNYLNLQIMYEFALSKDLTK
jgi:hypothetical protein